MVGYSNLVVALLAALPTLVTAVVSSNECNSYCGWSIVEARSCSTNTTDADSGPYDDLCLCSLDSSFYTNVTECIACAGCLGVWKYYPSYLTAPISECGLTTPALGVCTSSSSLSSASSSSSYTASTFISSSSSSISTSASSSSTAESSITATATTSATAAVVIDSNQCNSYCGWAIVEARSCSLNTKDTDSGPYDDSCLCNLDAAFYTNVTECIACAGCLGVWKYYPDYLTAPISECGLTTPGVCSTASTLSAASTNAAITTSASEVVATTSSSGDAAATSSAAAIVDSNQCNSYCGWAIVEARSCSLNTSDTDSGPYDDSCLCTLDAAFYTNVTECIACAGCLGVWKYYPDYLTAPISECGLTTPGFCSTASSDSSYASTSILATSASSSSAAFATSAASSAVSSGSVSAAVSRGKASSSPSNASSSSPSALATPSGVTFSGIQESGLAGFSLSINGGFGPFAAQVRDSEIDFNVDDSYVNIDGSSAPSSDYTLSTTEVEFSGSLSESQDAHVVLLGEVASVGEYVATVFLAGQGSNTKMVKRDEATYTLVATVTVTTGSASGSTSPVSLSAGSGSSITAVGAASSDDFSADTQGASGYKASGSSNGVTAVTETVVGSHSTVTYTISSCSSHKCSAVTTSGIVSAVSTTTDVNGSEVTIYTTVLCNTAAATGFSEIVNSNTAASEGDSTSTVTSTATAYSTAAAVSSYEGHANKAIANFGVSVGAILFGLLLL